MGEAFITRRGGGGSVKMGQVTETDSGFAISDPALVGARNAVITISGWAALQHFEREEYTRLMCAVISNGNVCAAIIGRHGEGFADISCWPNSGYPNDAVIFDPQTGTLFVDEGLGFALVSDEIGTPVEWQYFVFD